MSFIDKLWYQEHNLFNCMAAVPLLPLSWVFGAVVSLRSFLYSRGVLGSAAPAVPVVIIGGITAGGSGKTPLCAAVLKELRQQGYHPGLVSRGYKGHAASYPMFVEENSSASECGDEPLLLRRMLGSDVLVAVDPDRRRGAFALAKKGADIIVSDDGLQHYALDRDVEIAVIDSDRMLGNRHLLPAGPLRENSARLGTVDAVVCNGGGVMHTGHYAMKLKPSLPRSLTSPQTLLPKGSQVCAMAGTGFPERFYRTLTESGFKIADKIELRDHGRADLKVLKARAARYPVVMTAKDAVKYPDVGVDNLFVLEVEAQLSKFFYDNLMTCIRNSADRIKRRSAAAQKLKNIKEHQ